MSATDAALVEAARGGDIGAFEQLYQRYFGKLYDFAARTMKDRDAAADAVQDAFIKAHQRLDQLRDPSAFRPWMYSIVRRETVAWFRSRKREDVVATIDDADASRVNPLLAMASQDVSADPVVSAELADSAALVWEAAASLDPDTYTVLDLHVRQGLSSAEIADVLGITKGSAYTRLNRTKERAAGAISTYLLVRQGSRDCHELANVVAGHEIPPVTPDLRRSVDRHVSGCDSCERRRRALVAPMQLFAALAAVPPPDGLSNTVWANVRRAIVPPRWRRPLLIGASLLVVAFVGLGAGVLARNAIGQNDSGTALAATSTTNGQGLDASGDNASGDNDGTGSTSSTADAPDGGVGSTSSVGTVPRPTSPPSTVTSSTEASDTTPETTTTAADTTTTVADTTTTAPDSTPPALGSAVANPTEIHELDNGVISCPAGTPRMSQISVTASDAQSGLSAVTATWSTGTESGSIAMSASGSSYTAEIGPFTYPTAPDSGQVTVTVIVTAVDAEGNESKTSTAFVLHSLAKCFG